MPIRAASGSGPEMRRGTMRLPAGRASHPLRSGGTGTPPGGTTTSRDGFADG